MTRRLVAVLLLLALAGGPFAVRAGAQSAPGAAPAAEDSRPAESRCVVQRITDGDTFRCADGRRIRLLLIDAPERDQGPYGAQATSFVRKLIPVGTRVRLEYDVERRDRYGRDLAYVYTPDGKMLNEEIVRAGFAVVSVYPPNVRYVDLMRAAARDAREAERGLWSGSAFECLPSEHRRRRC